MPAHGKRYRGDVNNVDRDRSYPLDEAVAVLKSFRQADFDQTVDLCMHLGIDPRQADQAVRGSVSLPHGTGKTRRVIAFCTEDKVDAAREAGAIEAGGEELVKKINDGWMDFDVAVATPDMMKVVSRLGRVLGPRGLMPSPKSGTVAPDVEQAVKDYAAGKVEFRNDSGGNVHAPIGKFSFDPEQIQENARFFINTIMKMKPASTKGQFIRRVSMSGTMTPGVDVQV